MASDGQRTSTGGGSFKRTERASQGMSNNKANRASTGTSVLSGQPVSTGPSVLNGPKNCIKTTLATQMAFLIHKKMTYDE
ncbi:hypothetical protein Bhyg_11066 [Pseudolycoriella hygida]|uniref:Uncharacterized protein n=1 Tax=Pseudolycoriella hygida TaxID=35572 RepID=A0A9Q0MUT6_9DIPT|nr:hypothetical protein Bhyg_11066 [Pseudolycoriella hygida]